MAIPIALIVSYAFLTKGRFGGVRSAVHLRELHARLDPVYLSVLGQLAAHRHGDDRPRPPHRLPRRLRASRACPSRWRTLALVMIVLPFWSNFLIRTYAWIVLLNSEGPLNKGLMALGVIDQPLGLLYTRGAVIAGLLYAYLPLMILPLYASMERLDHSLIEAATNLGASRARAFFDVTLPAHPARRHDRRDLRVRAQPRQLHRPRAARRREDGHGRQSHPRPVPQGTRLALRRRARARDGRCSSSRSSPPRRQCRDASTVGVRVRSLGWLGCRSS